MSPTRRRFSQVLLRGAAGIALLLAIWEGFARSGMFSTALTPPLETVGGIFWGMLLDGTLVENAAFTLARLAAGLAIAAAIAIPLGMLMARSILAERIFLPVVSVLLPIPSLAWVPLLILWAGVGDLATILVVVYASSFPLIYNVWIGVRAVNPLWLRAATVMGADEATLLRRVIWPAALPYIITGARLAFGRGWIGVIGGELLASPEFGLGKIIFDAREFLDAGVMLATLLAIGALGIAFERFVFQWLEGATIRKWGMVAAVRR